MASKMIVSPFSASSSAWRRVPGRLSAALVTTMVFPFGIGISVGVGVACTGVDGIDDAVSDTTWVSVGDGLGPQPFKARIRMMITRNS